MQSLFTSVQLLLIVPRIQGAYGNLNGCLYAGRPKYIHCMIYVIHCGKILLLVAVKCNVWSKFTVTWLCKVETKLVSCAITSIVCCLRAINDNNYNYLLMTVPYHTRIHCIIIIWYFHGILFCVFHGFWDATYIYTTKFNFDKHKHSAHTEQPLIKGTFIKQYAFHSPKCIHLRISEDWPTIVLLCDKKSKSV